MNVNQRHAAMPGNPIQLALPNVKSPLLQEKEQGGILRQGVRQFNVAGPPLLGWNPERKDRSRSVRLRFKGVRIKGGRVIFNFEFSNPIEIVKHETGAESNGAPGFKVMVDAGYLPIKVYGRSKEAAVMVQIMYPHLKAESRATSRGDLSAAGIPLQE